MAITSNRGQDTNVQTETVETTATVGRTPYEGNRIYIGPTQPEYKLVKNSLFLGDLPEAVEAYLAEKPHLRRLIVPTADYAIAVKKMQTKGTPEFDAANR